MSMQDGDDQMDLVDELSAYLDEGKPAPVEKDAPEGDIETPEQEQARYVREGRRFVKEQVKEETKPEAKVEEKPPVAPAKPAWRPPWYKDEYGPWEQMSETFRNALREQERNAAQAIEKHSTAAKSWEPVTQALEPFAAELRMNGQSPQQFVGGLLNIYSELQQNPVDAINWLIQQRLGTDIYGLAQKLYDQNYQSEEPDPRDAKLAALEQKLQRLEQMPQRQKNEALQEQIRQWSQDKPDFAAVQPYMAAIAKQNPQGTLDEWYEQARWAHPEIRPRILQELEDKRLAELKDKRTAGAQSPRPQGPPASGDKGRFSKAKTTIEEDIAAALDAAAGTV